MRSLPARVAVALTVVVLTAGLAGGVATSSLPSTTQTAQESDSTPVVHPPNTTSYLQVPDGRVKTSTYGQAAVDVPGAMAIGSDRLRVHMSVESFEREFNRSVTTDNRSAAVAAAVRKLEALTDRGRQRQRTALAQYNAGEIGTEEFVRSLARSDALSRSITDAIRRVRTVGNSPFDYSIGGGMETRLTNMQPPLSTLRGQLRQVFSQAITGGQRLDDPVYIETGGNDIVLVTIVGNTYLRESFIGSAYAPTSRSTNRSRVRNRILNLYTWGFDVENYVSSPSIDTVGNTTVYVASVTHRQGRLDVHFDANTNDVFRESQAKRLSDLPIYGTSSEVNGTLRLTVNETHETGPMKVTVTDANTSAPRNATVYVGGTVVGTTGNDGVLWVVDRRGDTEVRAEAASSSVSMYVYGRTGPG